MDELFSFIIFVVIIVRNALFSSTIANSLNRHS